MRKSTDWILNGKGVAQQILAERALLARQSRDSGLVQMVRQLEAVRSRLAQAILSTSEVVPAATGGQATLVESLSLQEQELAARVSQSRGITLPDNPGSPPLTCSVRCHGTVCWWRSPFPHIRLPSRQ